MNIFLAVVVKSSKRIVLPQPSGRRVPLGVKNCYMKDTKLEKQNALDTYSFYSY